MGSTSFRARSGRFMLSTQAHQHVRVLGSFADQMGARMARLGLLNTRLSTASPGTERATSTRAEAMAGDSVAVIARIIMGRPRTRSDLYF